MKVVVGAEKAGTYVNRALVEAVRAALQARALSWGAGVEVSVVDLGLTGDAVADFDDEALACCVILQTETRDTGFTRRTIVSIREALNSQRVDRVFPSIIVLSWSPYDLLAIPDCRPWIQEAFPLPCSPEVVSDAVHAALFSYPDRIVSIGVRALVEKLTVHGASYRLPTRGVDELCAALATGPVFIEAPQYQERLLCASYLHERLVALGMSMGALLCDSARDPSELGTKAAHPKTSIGAAEMYLDLGDDSSWSSDDLVNLDRPGRARGLMIGLRRCSDVQDALQRLPSWQFRPQDGQISAAEVSAIACHFARADFAPGFSSDPGVLAKLVDLREPECGFQGLEHVRKALWRCAIGSLVPKAGTQMERQTKHSAKLQKVRRTERRRILLLPVPTRAELTGFAGEPTSMLYATSRLVSEVEAGNIKGLRGQDIELLRGLSVIGDPLGTIEREVRKSPCLAVCLSTTTPASDLAFRIAKRVKGADERCLVILGGPHERRNPNDRRNLNPSAWHERSIDFSVDGDGEFALEYLIRQAWETQLPPAALKRHVLKEDVHEEFENCRCEATIHFVSAGEGVQLASEGNPLVLDNLPLLPRRLLRPEDSFNFGPFRRDGRRARTAQVITRRGCPFRCWFCAENYRVNPRGIKAVERELAELGKLGYEAIFFDDSTFTEIRKGGEEYRQRQEFLLSLFDILSRDKWEWGCQTRVDQINDEWAKLLESHGCSYVFLGVESLDDIVLKDMHKRTTRQTVLDALDVLAKTKMSIGVSLMFGMPIPGSDLTRDDMLSARTTIDTIAERMPMGNIIEVSLNVTNYYPQSALTDKRSTPIDFSHSMPYPWSPWCRYAEASGYHATNVTAERVRKVHEYACSQFGPYLLKGDVSPSRHPSDPKPRLNLNYPAMTYCRSYDEKHEASSNGDAVVLARKVRQTVVRRWGGDRNDANVVLSRNSTEALGFALLMAGYYDDPGNAAGVVGVDNPALHTAFRGLNDFGNPSGRDLFVDFQPGMRASYDSTGLRRTTSRKGKALFRVRGAMSGTVIFEQVEKLLKEAPHIGIVVVPHVISATGEIVDIEGLTGLVAAVRPDAWLVVDGSYALNASPLSSFGKRVAYVAGVNYSFPRPPLGFCLVPGDSLPTLLARLQDSRYPVLEGMIDAAVGDFKSVGIGLSVPECEMFVEQPCLQRPLGTVATELMGAKEQVINALSGFDVSEPLPRMCQAPNILSCRLGGHDLYRLAEDLWLHERVLVTFSGTYNLLRMCIDPNIEDSKVWTTDLVSAIARVSRRARTLQPLRDV